MKGLTDKGLLLDPTQAQRFGFLYFGYDNRTSWWYASNAYALPLLWWPRCYRACRTSCAEQACVCGDAYVTASNPALHSRPARREALVLIRKLAAIATTVFLVGGDEPTVSLQLTLLTGIFVGALLLQARTALAMASTDGREYHGK
jgi:hypothetical protein